MSHATEQAKAHKARAFVDDKLNSHKVIVFSKTTQCPFSALVKKALKHYNIKDLNIIELDHRDDADEIYTYLSELTGSGNVCFIFYYYKIKFNIF